MRPVSAVSIFILTLGQVLADDRAIIENARQKLTQYHNAREIFRIPVNARERFFRSINFRDLRQFGLLRIKAPIKHAMRISSLNFTELKKPNFFFEGPYVTPPLNSGDIIRVISLYEKGNEALVEMNRGQYSVKVRDTRHYVLNFVRLSPDGRTTGSMETLMALAAPNEKVIEFDQYREDLLSASSPFIAKEAKVGNIITFINDFVYQSVKLPAGTQVVTLRVRSERIPFTFGYRYYTTNYFLNCPPVLQGMRCLQEMRDDNFTPNNFRGHFHMR